MSGWAGEWAGECVGGAGSGTHSSEICGREKVVSSEVDSAERYRAQDGPEKACNAIETRGVRMKIILDITHAVPSKTIRGG